jgi:hypothetical protein
MFGFYSPFLNILEVLFVSATIGVVTTTVGLVFLGMPRVESLSRTQLALAAPVGFASLAIFGLFCRGLFGSIISESAFQLSVIFCIVICIVISIFVYGKKLFKSSFPKQFRRSLVSLIGLMVLYFALSGALKNGIYSLPLRNGSDHIGYIQGAWFVLSDLFQAPNLDPGLSLMEMKSSILAPYDDRMLAYAATAVASLFVFGQWQWSYMTIAAAVFGFLGNYYIAVSRDKNKDSTLLVLAVFLLSQVFDILQMGYLGKGLFYLFAILVFGELLSSKETKNHLLVLFGLILGGVYSTMASIIFLTLFSACMLFALAIMEKPFRSRVIFKAGSRQELVLRKLGFLILGILASTGWTRNFQNPIDLNFNPRSDYTPLEILGNSWDFSWWGAPGQLGIIGLACLVLLLLAVATFTLLKLSSKEFTLVSSLLFCLAISTLILFGNGSWATYQLVSFCSLVFLLAISRGTEMLDNIND